MLRTRDWRRRRRWGRFSPGCGCCFNCQQCFLDYTPDLFLTFTRVSGSLCLDGTSITLPYNAGLGRAGVVSPNPCQSGVPACELTAALGCSANLPGLSIVSNRPLAGFCVVCTTVPTADGTVTLEEVTCDPPYARWTVVWFEKVVPCDGLTQTGGATYTVELTP